MLQLLQHKSPSYGPRTFTNGQSADLTLAFAVDFSTAGEKLTKKAAREYLAISMFDPAEESFARICNKIKACHAHSLNIAGNGIQRFHKLGINQYDVNRAIYNMLRQVHREHYIEAICSGGQTGVDLAGLVAAVKLGIPCIGMFPNGFLQRDEHGRDRRHTETYVRQIIEHGVANLCYE